MSKKIVVVFCAMLFCIIISTVILRLPSFTVRADSYSGGTVTINTQFTTGDLESAVTAQHAALTDITELTITKGELNDTDFYWMRDNLDNLVTLDIIEDATLVDDKIPTSAFSDSTGVIHFNITYVTINSAKTVGGYAFAYLPSIKDVKLPNAETIEAQAFSFSSLDTIQVPVVSTIGNGAFQYCNDLESIRIPLVTVLPELAFYMCIKLSYITIPNLTIMGDTSLGGTALEYADFPFVTSMSRGAVGGCAGLQSITFPQLTRIPEHAFVNSGNFTGDPLYPFFPNVTYIEKEAFSMSRITKASFPKVITIEESAFDWCQDLTDISLPQVESIGEDAFVNCIILEDMTLGAVPPTVGANAFNNTPVNKTLHVPSGSAADYRTVNDGDTSDNLWYGWTIDATLSTDSGLSEWIIEYDGGTQVANQFSLNLPYSTDEVIISATPNNVNSTVAGNIGTFKLATGQNDFVISITAENTYYKQNYDITVTRAENDENEIKSFFVDAYSGQIDNTNHTVDITMPYGASIGSFTPTITVSDMATISPASGVSVDFSTPVTYTVTAQDGSEQDYIVTVTEDENDDDRLLSFAFNGFNPSIAGYINHSSNKVEVNVPYGTDVTSLTPTIALPPGASINPASGATKDFSSNVTYIVTADDSSTREYIVTVSADENDDDNILSFSFNGLNPSIAGYINHSSNTIEVNVPYETDVTSLTPTIALPSGAAISPSSGIAQGFSNPITYTVTADDGSTREYIVTVTADENDEDKILTFAIDDLSPQVVGYINHTSNKIEVNVPYGTDVTSLTPVIALPPGAAISPSSGTAQDFSSTITYTVTADDGGTRDYIVDVTEESGKDVTNVLLSFDTDFLTKMKSGDKISLSAFVIPYDAANKSILWQSSDTSIVTVDSRGFVAAISPGDAYITVRAEDKTDVCYITVLAEENEEELSETAIPTNTPAPEKSQITEKTKTKSESTPQKTEIPITSSTQSEAGTVIITINVSNLPEGTKKIQLPNGQTVVIEGLETLQISVSKEDVKDDGTVEILTIDDDEVALGFVNVDASDHSEFRTIFIALISVLVGASITLAILYTLINRKKNK